MSTQDLNAFSALIRSLSEESSGLHGSSTSNLAASLPSASAPLAPFLSLKSALLLSYTQHLVMLSSHRLLGLSLAEDEQGSELVRNLVRMRVLLEKSKTVEAKLRPRWEREIRAYQTEQNKIAQGIKGASDDEDEEDDEIDPMAFRPNPSALLDDSTTHKASSSSKKSKKASNDDESAAAGSSSVYRPPKLAPVPYTAHKGHRRDDRSESGSDNEMGGRSSSRRGHRPLNTHLLSDLSSSLSALPASLSASGLSNVPASAMGASARARRLQEADDFEENNYTRLVQSKKEARKRRREEEDVALGGVTTMGAGKGGKIGGGMEEEFGDLLRGGERSGNRKEWDELKKRKRTNGGAMAADRPSGNGRREGGGSRGGGSRRGGRGGSSGSGGNRFEKAVKSHGKKR